jgi:phospholipid transport system transporter-binding protein
MQLPAAVTLAEAGALLAQLGADVDTVDASALTTCDTSAVALLLEARRRAHGRGVTLVVRNAPQKLVSLARLYGVDGLLSFEGVST